jgi:hypothetical protein
MTFGARESAASEPTSSSTHGRTMMEGTEADVRSIESWHAHVYFDATQAEDTVRGPLREGGGGTLGRAEWALGRVHETRRSGRTRSGAVSESAIRALADAVQP